MKSERERLPIRRRCLACICLEQIVFICEINKNRGQGADISDLSAHQGESAEVLDEVTMSAPVSPLS